MDLTRRQFLMAGGAGIGLIGLGGYKYLNNEKMRPTPVREDYVLCDLHAHPSKEKPLEKIVKGLGSPGLIGLTYVSGNDYVLTYEEARELIQKDSRLRRELEEITSGQLARFKEGYFARGQELEGEKHHFLALGFEGDYFSDDPRSPIEVITAIKERKGLVGLNHPGIIREEGKFRLPTLEEAAETEELCQYVDLIEVHNGHNIRTYLPFIDNMGEANELAKLLVRKCWAYRECLGVYASSDTHREWEQVKTSGVYVPKERIKSVDTLKEYLKSGERETYEGYISRLSFLKGLVLPRVRNRILGK